MVRQRFAKPRVITQVMCRFKSCCERFCFSSLMDRTSGHGPDDVGSNPTESIYSCSPMAKAHDRNSWYNSSNLFGNFFIYRCRLMAGHMTLTHAMMVRFHPPVSLSFYFLFIFPYSYHNYFMTVFKKGENKIICDIYII